MNRENVREGSKVVARADVLEVSNVPETYRVEYRVENRAGENLTTTTEKVWVRRPFNSRVETWKAGKTSVAAAERVRGAHVREPGLVRAVEHRGAAEPVAVR